MERVGILGPRGTHSEAAAIRLNQILSYDRELVICGGIFEILKAVENGGLDAGFVPVENSLEGSINITLDTLARSESLVIEREFIWTVHNHLMAKDGVKISDVKKIFSHAQPLSQCRKFLQETFSQVELAETTSTSRAAEIVSASELSDGYAAICSERAGELNHLVKLASEIQDNAANRTRFFEVRRRTKKFYVTQGDKVLIICQIDGSRAGSLCEVLKEFAFRHVNMTRIESRPARTELGEYIFFFDLENNVDRRTLNDALGGVKHKSIWLKDLGTFPVISC
ncbi:MAG: prephenate dehydratase [Selenomonadaceae bacterium]|nr:prephenate dehydratase [Selenomonadaceae bacterium]